MRKLQMWSTGMLLFILPAFSFATEKSEPSKIQEITADKESLVVDPLSLFLLESGKTLATLENEVRTACGSLGDTSTYLRPDTAKKVFGDEFENLSLEDRRSTICYLVNSFLKIIANRVEGNDSPEYWHLLDKAALAFIHHRVEWLTLVNVVFSDPLYVPIQNDIRELFICLKVLAAKFGRLENPSEQQKKIHRRLLKIKNKTESLIFLKKLDLRGNQRVKKVSDREISLPLRINLKLAPSEVYSIPEDEKVFVKTDAAIPEHPADTPPKLRERLKNNRNAAKK